MALPLMISLKSECNQKYLSYNESQGGLLKFSDENPLDPLARIEVVPAESVSGFIHLKSCYTNKYFVRQSLEEKWITAEADKPNENQSDWLCTLFKPEIIKDNGDTKKATLKHVQSESYAGFYHQILPGKDHHSFNSCLYVAPKIFNIDHLLSWDVFTILDLSTVEKLPQQVVFKSDLNKYLGVYSNDNTPYLGFSFDSPDDPKVAHEVFGADDGTVNIKSKCCDKFWRVNEDGFIVADVVDSDDTSKNDRAMFTPKFTDINVVALLNASNNLYCKRYLSHYGYNLLSASASSVDGLAKFHFEDIGSKPRVLTP